MNKVTLPSNHKPGPDFSFSPLIILKGVTKVYKGLSGHVQALQDINLHVNPGEFLAITGKSGAGKTTLVNMITGLDHCTQGEIFVSGSALHKFGSEQAASWRGRNVGVVFQTFELLPSLSVLHNVTLPMEFAGVYSPKLRLIRAISLLKQVGVAEHANKKPSAVSGGQQQRVAIARALANDPPLIIADEPTGSLDTVTASIVLKLFSMLVKQGKTILLATHDQDILQYCSRAIMLSDGKMIQGF